MSGDTSVVNKLRAVPVKKVTVWNSISEDKTIYQKEITESIERGAFGKEEIRAVKALLKNRLSLDELSELANICRLIGDTLKSRGKLLEISNRKEAAKVYGLAASAYHLESSIWITHSMKVCKTRT